VAVSRRHHRLLSLFVPVAVIGALVAPAAGAHAAVAPTVVITSPDPTATITGLVGVGVTSSTDPNGTDYPSYTDLYIDGVLESSHNPCLGTAKTCVQNHLWSSDGLQGVHIAQAKLTTRQGVVVSSPVVHYTVVNPRPVVTITTPLDGQTVSGSVVVSTQGHLDASQSFDFPQTMSLAVDGTTVASANCGVASQTECDADLTWESDSSAAGTHTLVATLTTTRGNTGSSAPLQVTEDAYPLLPVVTLLDPPDGTSFYGQMGFIASGTVARNERPAYLILVLDDQVYGSPASCDISAGSRTCALDVILDGAGIVGQHKVQVALFDTSGHEGLTAPITVTVLAPQSTPTVLSLTPSATATRGSAGVVHGLVTNKTTGAGVSGAPVTVVFTPVNAPSQTVNVVTDPQGAFTATDPATLTGNTSVTATTSASFGSSSASETIPVAVSIRCIVPGIVKHQTPLSIDCATPGLANGSVVAMHFGGTIPRATDYERVVNGHVTFKVTYWTVGAVHTLWATTAATKTFVAARSATYTLKVS
jgi:hypothetical protein